MSYQFAPELPAAQQAFIHTARNAHAWTEEIKAEWSNKRGRAWWFTHYSTLCSPHGGSPWRECIPLDVLKRYEQTVPPGKPLFPTVAI
jgi:hypothetical protein